MEISQELDGNAALFRGLARGQMSVVAPLSAVLTAALPALVGLVTGDRLSPLGWTGLVLALPAICLVSWAGSGAGFRLADLGYGLLAGGGFGLLFIALDRAGSAHGAWPLLPGQLVALLVVVAAAVPVLRRPRYRRWPPWAGVLAWSIPTGLLGATANYCFLAATGAGQLTVAAVLAGLYPAVTVLLAMLMLRERPRLSQTTGLIGAGAAVVAMAVG